MYENAWFLIFADFPGILSGGSVGFLDPNCFSGKACLGWHLHSNGTELHEYYDQMSVFQQSAFNITEHEMKKGAQNQPYFDFH